MKILSRLLFALLLLVGLIDTAAAVPVVSTAIDVTAVLQGISDAGVALLAVIGALMTLSVSLFGITKVYRFISRKAGA